MCIELRVNAKSDIDCRVVSTSVAVAVRSAESRLKKHCSEERMRDIREYYTKRYYLSTRYLFI